jgi:signal transduction histidine kinase
MEQIGRLVIFDDITERAELESRLVQADKLSSIGLLAAGVAHEVNTPLAVISTYAQMLSKQVAGDEQKSRMLEKISRQSFRASEIVNSLLNFSRTSSTELVEVQINRVVQETLSLLEHQLRKASIEVRVNLEPDLEPVKGNAGKLQQVFLNLFLNARDAMEAAPPRATGEGHRVLEIVTRRGENGVEVDVLDTGSGIAPSISAAFTIHFSPPRVPEKAPVSVSPLLTASFRNTGAPLRLLPGLVRVHVFISNFRR